MGKVYLNENVYDATIRRLNYIFDNFKHIYFSFSGGKDSSVMVQLANKVAKERHRTFDVLYIDLEGNYKATRNHVKEIKELSQIDQFYWVCLPLKLRNGVSNTQTHWVCWDEDYKKNIGNWIRTRPADSINIKNYTNYGWSWFVEKMQFEDFVIEFAKWYYNQFNEPCACGVGIRANESMNRFRTIISTKKTKFNANTWTTLIKATDREVFNFYPLFDWETKDIWIATFKHNLMFNNFYEIMYKSGMSIHETRLCQPYGDDQRDGLAQFKFFEPETWGKVLMRVNGANFGNIYSKTAAIGKNNIIKPEHLTWEQYAVYLLESIGTVNYDLMLHYTGKIKKFISWYSAKGITIADEAPLHLEASKKTPSWRRVCKMIIKNDYYGKSLSFSQTKTDDIRLNQLLEKWSEKI